MVNTRNKAVTGTDDNHALQSIKKSADYRRTLSRLTTSLNSIRKQLRRRRHSPNRIEIARDCSEVVIQTALSQFLLCVVFQLQKYKNILYV